jgi:predicted ribosomally synthesized peptide with SipW-like signal peptide
MTKKLIISLSIIGAVAVVATGATIALFNDTETSTGNILIAGNLDLKVDHLSASYNGNPCTENCVEDTNANANLILNGSFEVPEVTNSAKWEIFPNGTLGLEWTVEWEGGTTSYGGFPRPEPALVEYHENVAAGWTAQSGDQYAELDSDWYGPSSSQSGEPALTRIYQNIATTPGNQYKLRYYFSPRPNTGSGENILYVRIDNVQVQSQGPTAGGGATNWTEYTYTFTASNALTKIEFAGGGTNNSLGVFLDNVRVNPINCTYQITGGTCTLWEEKDLGPNDYYWHYNDVKPGDYGRNVISLRVYDNDAWGCLIIHDEQDNENDRIDPEVEAGDLDDDPLGGELSQFLKVFAWKDDNANAVFEPPSETVVVPADTPLPIIETEIIALSLVSTNPIYVGLAWCVGTQTVDINTGVISCSGSGNRLRGCSFAPSTIILKIF